MLPNHKHPFLPPQSVPTSELKEAGPKSSNSSSQDEPTNTEHSEEKPTEAVPMTPAPTTGEAATSGPKETESQGEFYHPSQSGSWPSRNPKPTMGLPPQAALETRKPTDKDRETIRARLEQEQSKMEHELVPPSGFLRVPKFLFGSATLTVLLGVTGLLGLLIVSQVISTLAQVARFPWWTQVFFWIAFLLLCSAVLFAVVRLIRFYLRLRRVEQVPLQGLLEINQRSAMRNAARQHKRKAVQQLQIYLEEYEPEQLLCSDELSPICQDEMAIRAIRNEREKLLNRDLMANYDRWLLDFEENFQCRLDQLAQDRIAFHARQVGIKTAISPNALIDVMIAIYYGMAMLGDLCRVYKVRLGTIHTGFLLAWIFFNAYVAGQSHDMEDATADQIEGWLAESQITGLIAGKVGSRAASGAFNWFLMRRLGNVTRRLLQPIAPSGAKNI